MTGIKVCNFSEYADLQFLQSAALLSMYVEEVYEPTLWVILLFLRSITESLFMT